MEHTHDNLPTNDSGCIAETGVNDSRASVRSRWSRIATSDFVRVAGACLAVGCFAGLLTLWLSLQIPERLYDVPLCDAYFGSDLPRTYAEMVSPTAQFNGEKRHPLYSLILFPLSSVVHRALGVSLPQTACVVCALNASLWACLVLVISWTLTRRVGDSILLSLLALSCAGALFWLPVPETFPFGATTILLVITILCLRHQTSGNYVLHVVGHIVSVSMTLTNWMAGLIVSLVREGPRNAFSIMLHALAVVFLFTCVQAKLFARPNVFTKILGQAVEFKNSIAERRPPIDVAKDFVLTSLSPSHLDYRVIPNGGPDGKSDLPSVDVLTRGGPLLKTLEPCAIGGKWRAIIPWFAWSALLACGLHAGLRRWRYCLLLRAILLCAAGQFVLHCLYGYETFLYASHWLALLVLIAGVSLTTRFRTIAIGVMVFLMVYNYACNIAMYCTAMNILRG